MIASVSTTGILFLLSIVFYPLIATIAGCSAVTAPALFAVGVLMAQQLKGIEWDNLVYATSAFVTVTFMILGYSISNGIALGFIAYAVSMLACGRAKEVKLIVWALVVIFIIYFGFLI